jgi:hypothetical protein
MVIRDFFNTPLNKLYMKNRFLQLFLIIVPLFFEPPAYSQIEDDSLKFGFSFNYFKDFSDTYGGGNMFAGEFGVKRSWYGAKLSFGHFQSQADFIFKIPLEETPYVLEIPFEEMAIMKMGTLSLTIIPIQRRWFEAELLLGLALASAQNSCFKGVEYTFDIAENRFTYLSKDYQLIKNTHVGYQIGFNMTFFPHKKVGLQINTRMQDLSNGGTFFLIGGGIFFRL